MEEQIGTINQNIGDIKTMLQSFVELLNETNKKVDLLEQKLDHLTEKLIPECEKMGSHINFVQDVYENVKYPLEYVCNQFHSLTNYNHITPVICDTPCTGLMCGAQDPPAEILDKGGS